MHNKLCSLILLKWLDSWSSGKKVLINLALSMASNIIRHSYLHLKSDKCQVHPFMPVVTPYSNLKQNFLETRVAKWLIRSCIMKRDLLPYDRWRKDLNNNSWKYSSPTSSMLRFSPGSCKKPSAIHKWTIFFFSNSYSGRIYWTISKASF